MAEGSAGAPSAPSCRRCVGPPSSAVAPRCCGGGCGLGRLVRRLRRLRRQGRQALCAAAARPATSTLRSCQYDPLSYARNFDGSGFGAAPDDDSDAAQLYYSYTFSSRFVLAPTSSSSAAASAPSGLTSRPVATSH